MSFTRAFIFKIQEFITHQSKKKFFFLLLCTQFPQIGELILQRLILQFKRGFRRNDKALCLSSTRFVAHLVNQQVVRVTMRFIHRMTTDYKKKHVTVLLLLKFHTSNFQVCHQGESIITVFACDHVFFWGGGMCKGSSQAIWPPLFYY